MMQIADVTPDRFNIRIFLESYSAEVREFGESVPPTWVDDKLSGIATGQEFCIGATEGDELKGILVYSYKERRGYSFVCWETGEVDREGLLLLIREFANRSPQGTKLRISGLHPHIDPALMSSVSEGLGFLTRRRFEMTAPIDGQLDGIETSIQYPTASITKFDDISLSKLDWLAYQGTVDATLLFDNEEENRKLLKSLLEGDYGPVIADASLCVLKEGKPSAMIAVTDIGDAAFVADIVVSPEIRGQGIATYLMVNAMRISRRLKKERMVLWVSEGNDNAMSLYKSLGFVLSRTGIYYLKDPE